MPMDRATVAQVQAVRHGRCKLIGTVTYTLAEPSPLINGGIICRPSPGVPILLNTGKIMISEIPNSRFAADAIVARHTNYAIEGSELLTAEELQYRYPQINTENAQWGLFSQGAAGSVILARKGISTVVEEFVKNGGRFEIAYVKPDLSGADKMHVAHTADGQTINAEAFCFCLRSLAA